MWINQWCCCFRSQNAVRKILKSNNYGKEWCIIDQIMKHACIRRMRITLISIVQYSVRCKSIIWSMLSSHSFSQQKSDLEQQQQGYELIIHRLYAVIAMLLWHNLAQRFTISIKSAKGSMGVECFKLKTLIFMHMHVLISSCVWLQRIGPSTGDDSPFKKLKVWTSNL